MLLHVIHALRTSVSCRKLVMFVSMQMLLYTAVTRVAGVYMVLTLCSSSYVLVHLHAMRYVARYPSSQASCADHVQELVERLRHLVWSAAPSATDIFIMCKN